jgi:putative effector of murein hydrolase LrgA (UPF0299 family)
MKSTLIFALLGVAVDGFQQRNSPACFRPPARNSSVCNPLLNTRTSSSLALLRNDENIYSHEPLPPKETSLHLSSTPVGGSQSEPFKTIKINKPLAAASLLVILDILFRWLFEALAISFPSSLAGCGIMFASFLLAPGGDKLYQLLSPGAALLAKWLPVFFVPSLITLPLADSVASVSEVTFLYHVTRKFWVGHLDEICDS